MKKENKKIENAEKELKNIRIILGNNIKQFSSSIGISEEKLKKIETGKEKLTQTELYCICSVIMNTIGLLTSDIMNNEISNSTNKDQVQSNRDIIVKRLAKFIHDYNPANQNSRENTTNNEKVSYVGATEAINPNDKRLSRKK